MDMFSFLYLIWITSKDPLHSIRDTAQCYVAAWMGGESTCVCMAESLCCSHETNTTLLISYTPIQNKKLKKKKLSFAHVFL